jgi:hypothetical protein
MKMILAIVVFAVAIPVLAQNTLKPLAVGTVFTLVNSNGVTRAITVKNMKGVTITQEELRENGTRTIENIGFGARLSAERDEAMSDSSKEKVAALFPLKVGNNAQYDYNGISRGHPFGAVVKTEIIAEESMVVPAGTFQTFVMRTDISAGKHVFQNTCWYAPVIGYCAKQIWKNKGEPDSIIELVSVTPPK